MKYSRLQVYDVGSPIEQSRKDTALPRRVNLRNAGCAIAPPKKRHARSGRPLALTTAFTGRLAAPVKQGLKS
ncbi:hypothetical protein QUA81_28570 [Microcoleus sp. F6_B4]|uniref:hypothetical protein n=1 Tax=unclassified Microcoleus TaxID=2642155 RepID=UPI002FD1EF7B